MYFTYRQNNSGGSFTVDRAKGIGHFVIIEASNAFTANLRAEHLGLYWDGVSEGTDCGCCGDRWDPMETEGEWADVGSDTPEIYGGPVSEHKDHFGTGAYLHPGESPFQELIAPTRRS